MLAVVFLNGNSDAFKNIDHQWMVGSSNSNSFISTVQKKWFDLLWRKSTWIPSVGKNILLDALKQNQDIACCTDRLLVSALPGSKITTHQGQKLYSCSSATYKTSLTHRMATRKLPEWQRICAVWFVLPRLGHYRQHGKHYHFMSLPLLFLQVFPPAMLPFSHGTWRLVGPAEIAQGISAQEGHAVWTNEKQKFRWWNEMGSLAHFNLQLNTYIITCPIYIYNS